MAAEVTPPVPGRRDMEAAVQVIHDNADRLFLWDYERDRGQLVTLYNKAMGSQWNSVTDLDWSIDVDPERLVAEQDSPLLAVARVAGTLPGSPMAKWTEKEYSQLGIEFFKANLSQFMHGEQGAMMTAAKIVETVPWIDAKYYASTQTMDEARHTEVFAKYLRTKLGDAYPMSPFLKAQIWSLLEDSRWDIAYLGMQIVIESLALAAFGDMLRRTKEPLLTKLLRYVMSDEARHVAFGVLTLSEFYGDLSEAELKERQEFLVDATLNSAGAGDDARGVGAHGHDGRGGLPLHHARRPQKAKTEPDAAASPGASSPSSSPTCASSACSTPTTATCARDGARRGCSSSSSPTTPGPTTSPTTPWPRTGPAQSTERRVGRAFEVGATFGSAARWGQRAGSRPVSMASMSSL